MHRTVRASFSRHPAPALSSTPPIVPRLRHPARNAPPTPDAKQTNASAGERPRIASNPIGPIVFPEELPVSARRDEIADAIRRHQVVIVSGETGSGKTTQLPKICLSIGRGLGAGGHGLIGHTQPRRLAATATARRIAAELNAPLGEHVGFKIRFHDRLSPGASIKLMTDGILLAETQSDPLLAAYDTIIIDEAHERSLNIDFLLGYLKQLLPRRSDLKLIVTSATIDAQRFARHFGSDAEPAPVIEVSGRLYPVELRYRPVRSDDPRPPTTADSARRDAVADERGLNEAVVDAVDELARIGPGDVLVFFAGEREIREAATVLRGHHPPHTEILPLFARLSAEEQERVFKPASSSAYARRIVLATNVAETSLTVPGIRYVVDTGVARVKRYSYRNKVEQLRSEAISRAAANQRAGRCGRVAAGVCIRLYDEADFDARPAFTDPEILRSSLAAVILRMKTLDLGEIEDFPFIEPPQPRAITDGYQLLNELGAIDDANALTPLGRTLGRLPLDPRIGRMIVAAREHDCLAEMLILASALSVQDPRDRPVEQREAADEAHKAFVDERSDFLSDLKLWHWYASATGESGSAEHRKSQRQLRELCRSRFVSPLRMREWRDVHHQLATTVAEHHWRPNERPATDDRIHKAMLAGLLGNIGVKTEEETNRDAQYLGARGIRFSVWPGSTLARKGASAKSRWVVAAELVETQKLFARKVARIEPEWVEEVGAHLLKTSHGDPHWEKKAAAVIVLERGTVHGLPVYGQRRVDYAAIDPRHARQIFLREGLVEAMLARDAQQSPFDPRDPATVRLLAHDRRQIAAVEELEHKTRRPDVLVDAELLVAFCDARVPDDVASGAAFEAWYRDASKGEPRLLYLDRDELMRHEAAGAGSDAFPKTIESGGIAFALDYLFDPGSPRDGVTMTVPLYALNVVDAARCEWLVPGMAGDKVQTLLKSLPQKLRRHCVPLPAYADAFVASAVPGGPLIDALIADLRERKGVVATAADFRLEAVPPHLLMNFRIVDEHGRQLGIGRHLATLRAELGQQARHQFREAFARAGPAVRAATPIEARPTTPVVEAEVEAAVDEPLVDWSFGVLPELLEVRRGGQAPIGYPALVDRRTHAVLEVFDDADEAARAHRGGLARLFRLQLHEQLRYLEKNLPDLTRMAMQYMTLGTVEELRDQIVGAAVERACLGDPLPTDPERFAARKAEAKSRLVLLANETARTVATILDQYQLVLKKTQMLKGSPAALADIEAQLAALVGPRFVATTPPARLAHLPRYLKAIALRIDKRVADPRRDDERMAELAPLAKNSQRANAQRKGAVDPGLDEFRWLLEELRVALFAQELRTPMPVSVKRLHKVWDSLQR